VVEVEMVLAASEPLVKKEMIPLESVTLEEGEEVILSSDALLVTWYSWDPFSLLGWTRGHQQSSWYF